MEDLINMTLKNIIINIFSIIIFFKLTQYNIISKRKKFWVIILSIFISVIFVNIKINQNGLIAMGINIILLSIMFRCFINKKLLYIMLGVIVSISVTYILDGISMSLEYFLQKICKLESKTINVIFTLFIESIIIYFFMKIKKIKNGLSFFKNTNEYIEIAIMDISLFVIISYILVGYSNDNVINKIYMYFFFIAFCMIITLQKILSIYYKNKLMNDTLNEYKNNIEEKDNEIKRLTEETFKVSKVNHEFYNRQKSLESMVMKAIENGNMSEENKEEILQRINEITKEHTEKMEQVKVLHKLDLTDIPEIDDMFKYMQEECDKNNIKFKLKVEGNIHSLVNNFIPKNKLETLIGDHIRDAIIAVNHSDNDNKEIFTILGIKNDCYELCILDTGIEFEINTLLNLGLSPATTHKDDGGSGIGFMTTFETLNECKASLIIDEKELKDGNIYTKAVTIKFDGKNEYRINSYRAEEIMKQNNGRNIIINDSISIAK